MVKVGGDVKRSDLLKFLIWKDTKSYAYVPMKDQNLIVQGKNTKDLLWLILGEEKSCHLKESNQLNIHEYETMDLCIILEGRAPTWIINKYAI